MSPSFPHDPAQSPAPLNASSIHTQGHNFLHAVQSSVDPRTGQFNLSINLPLGEANDLAGPTWSFALGYSAMASQQDEGFGLGWSLRYTQLTLVQNLWTLRLSSGEQFSVDLANSDLGPGGQLAFHDYKLKAMQVSLWTDNDPAGEVGFRILHKTGEAEFLRRVGRSGSQYVLHELRSPEGRSLHFDWARANDVLHLQTVRDGQRTLARYDRQQRVLTLEPDSSEPSQFQFILSNQELTRLVVPEIHAPFTFGYLDQAVGNQRLRLPTQVSGPLGATDRVNWSQTLEASHRLPNNAPIAYMPRVTSWLHTDGPGAPALLRTYGWVGSNNYLGGASPQGFNWEQGRDSLYRLGTRYEYQCIEYQSAGDLALLQAFQLSERNTEQGARNDLDALLAELRQQGVAPSTTITRTWDRHHLQIREVTVSGDCEILQETVYGVDYDQPWLVQPPQCQLPHLNCTTYIDHAVGSRCSEEISYTYDVFGNTLQTSFPTGVIEVNDYYPASGDLMGCPADASGMVRYLKSRTVYPAPGCPGDAPVLRTRYEYEALASLIDGDMDHAVVCLEELVDVRRDTVLESTSQTYERQDKTHYGRQRLVLSTLNGLTTTTRYDYRVVRAPGAPALLETRTQIDGFENTEVSRSVSADTRSLITGLTHSETSADGSQTVYAYDALGRAVRTVIANGTDYETARTCAYHVDDGFVAEHAPRLGDELEVHVALEETDATGQRKRSWLDGSGRLVLMQLEDLDHRPGVFLDIERIRYDAWGRMIEQRSQDWSPEGDLLFSLTQTNDYDDWGNVCRQTAPTGVVTHTRNDPSQRCIEHWQQSPGGALSARQLTILNVAGSPVQSVFYDSQGRSVRTQDSLRDGLDRLIEQRVTPRGGAAQITRFEYDHYGRICKRHQHFTEQDRAHVRTVAFTYAAHSDGDHPESICAAVSIGEQP
ncbi:hypothetical protein [Pseudomonas cremoricolorata]|uniref:Sugar-binding protein n=1 Tax=Pseudomonas cremoricolorata TaxID=157783 RepID=A0A089WFA4_9PSED|nr:hypothetical protein [Pseudomonas cremoricolorata]AIR87970.1 hypothetical protein LK03_01390 [Pseudomonas cremoricolorata]